MCIVLSIGKIKKKRYHSSHHEIFRKVNARIESRLTIPVLPWRLLKPTQPKTLKLEGEKWYIDLHLFFYWRRQLQRWRIPQQQWTKIWFLLRHTVITTLDPSVSYSTELTYMANIYETLIRVNPPGSKTRFSYLLATGMSASDDGLDIHLQSEKRGQVS